MIKLVSKANPNIYIVVEENNYNFEESAYGFTITMGETEDSDVVYVEKSKWRKESFDANVISSKTPLYYCKNNSNRGKAIIEELEKRGGINTHNHYGNSCCNYYYIDPHTKIIEIAVSSFIREILDKIGTEVKLPSNTEHIESVLLDYIQRNKIHTYNNIVKELAYEILEAAKEDIKNK